MTDFISRHRKEIFFPLLTLALFVWVGIIFLGNKTYVDEATHCRQIQRFFKGNYSMIDDLTTIPGYHAVIATSATILFHGEKQPSLQEVRMVSLFFSILSIVVFFRISKTLRIGNPWMRTLQYAFFPVTFLYFPLVYTDLFSIFLLLTAFLLSLKKKYLASALVSLSCVLVRQDSILWIAFIWLFPYVSEFGYTVSTKHIMAFLKKTFWYAPVFLFFIAFVWQNGGIAIGDKESHVFGLYAGNVYFFLALTGLLFLPIIVATVKNATDAARKRFLTIVLPIGAALGLSFVLLPPVLHKYNLDAHFLRNLALGQAYGDYRWLYVLMIVIGIGTLFFMDLKREYLVIFPFILAGALPSLLIEQRYLIVPFVFLLLFRKDSTKKAERLLTSAFILISLSLTFMLLRMDLFL
ncbi:MAG: hypothetical protein WCJ25_00890 [Candidatus Moraniibacteriota bacterium]